MFKRVAIVTLLILSLGFSTASAGSRGDVAAGILGGILGGIIIWEVLTPYYPDHAPVMTSEVFRYDRCNTVEIFYRGGYEYERRWTDICNIPRSSYTRHSAHPFVNRYHRHHGQFRHDHYFYPYKGRRRHR